MVMTGVWKIVPCVGYAHVAQTKAAPKSSFNNRAILRPYEVKIGTAATMTKAIKTLCITLFL
jgi:hypothetical protein